MISQSILYKISLALIVLFFLFEFLHLQTIKLPFGKYYRNGKHDRVESSTQVVIKEDINKHNYTLIFVCTLEARNITELFELHIRYNEFVGNAIPKAIFNLTLYNVTNGKPPRLVSSRSYASNTSVFPPEAYPTYIVFSTITPPEVFFHVELDLSQLDKKTITVSTTTRAYTTNNQEYIDEMAKNDTSFIPIKNTTGLRATLDVSEKSNVSMSTDIAPAETGKDNDDYFKKEVERAILEKQKQLAQFQSGINQPVGTPGYFPIPEYQITLENGAAQPKKNKSDAGSGSAEETKSNAKKVLPMKDSILAVVTLCIGFRGFVYH